jgi:transposase
MFLVGLSLARRCGRTLVLMLLHAAHLSWKKPKKILAKANTAKRLEYLQRFEQLYEEMQRGERTLIYLDEAHLHQDMDSGYGWYFKGRRWLVPSTTPGLHARINWYGAYNFTDGKAMIWSYPKCDGANTADFLHKLAEWAKDLPKPTLIWDGSPVHRAKVAQDKASELGFELIPLPGYSPDLNPIEGLWKWMREEVTYAYCQPSLDALFAACKMFISQVNVDPQAMIMRLWPRFELDPDEEKLRVSA